ncbi:glycosyl transferase [Geobacillus sp. Manikaran-105]|uniref:glycosyltransferase family 2 protein n=1 Tax=Geobacillus TaxID=129337 RepID=UPI000C285D23|nr:MULTISPECIES: glycosyltransferase [Geobacillus]PJW13729.1 glycosyl transferase [Geobacillus sp. Manikaran-105]TLS32623.1 glycosyltransferase family 2 protein [Geobacillus thermoleovorans]
MNTNLSFNQSSPEIKPRTKAYIPVKYKFIIGHIVAFLWLCFSVYVSVPWVFDLAHLVSFPLSVVIIAGLAYIPGYLTAFLVVSLLLDRQPPLKTEYPDKAVTILIAARNEADKIENTLKYIAKQDYNGEIRVLLVDNGSTDQTVEKARRAAMRLGLDVTILKEEKPGKFHALNKGLQHVSTDLMITLDADTLLHRSAVRYLIARIESAPVNVCAVAGAVLVRNSRENLLARIQEWDYFLGIASIKRMQGLYQGTLVAQGAYSLYKTEAIREVGGWPDAIGEDIVLSWRLLEKGWRIYFEPHAVAFTDVPVSWVHFCRQRSRWARGMIEALKVVKPWQQPQLFVKYLTMVNLLLPYLDTIYTLCWLPGLILAFFGYYYIVGPMTLLVVPLTLIAYWVLYRYQRSVFRKLDLKIRRNRIGFVVFVLFYQMIMSPVSFWGYIQELARLRRVWK